MSSDVDLTARQASIGGRFAQYYLRFCAVSCWLTIFLFPGLQLFGGIDLPWWGAVLTCVGVGLIMLLIGFVMWDEAVSAKADTGRLRTQGRPAIAEILDLEVTDPGDGSADVARMTLRISGEDVPEFEAVYREDHDKKLFRVGASYKAIVDPSDNLFTLKPVRLNRPDA